MDFNANVFSSGADMGPNTIFKGPSPPNSRAGGNLEKSAKELDEESIWHKINAPAKQPRAAPTAVSPQSWQPAPVAQNSGSTEKKVGPIVRARRQKKLLQEEAEKRVIDLSANSDEEDGGRVVRSFPSLADIVRAQIIS
jgi:hypothetical protein